jgi:hypothetical protein
MFYAIPIAAALSALVLSLYLDRQHRCEVAALRAALRAAELRADTVAWLASQRADAAVRARTLDCRHTLWQAGYDQALADVAETAARKIA